MFLLRFYWEMLIHLLEIQFYLAGSSWGGVFGVPFLSDVVIIRCEKHQNPATCCTEACSPGGDGSDSGLARELL